MKINQRLKIFIISLIFTMPALRIYLLLFPSSNLYIFGYNIHHLFIGAFLIVIVLLLFIFDIINKLTIMLAGVSSALILDEIVYLIATDGSDISYLSSVSLFGAMILTAIILILAIVLYNQQKHKSKE
ncbi:hypothetical protein HYX00_05110 [Candidatus Woesearchaeota archaeon]|nr:hypothetical protein [Candidatus Woesearchaeota archaeon]